MKIQFPTASISQAARHEWRRKKHDTNQINWHKPAFPFLFSPLTFWSGDLQEITWFYHSDLFLNNNIRFGNIQSGTNIVLLRALLYSMLVLKLYFAMLRLRNTVLADRGGEARSCNQGNSLAIPVPFLPFVDWIELSKVLLSIFCQRNWTIEIVLN